MIDFKKKKDQKLFASLHPILIMIFADMYNYAYEKHGVNLVVTDTVSTKLRDKMLGRVSKAHQQKRAIDIRTKDLDAFVVEDIIKYITSKSEYHKYWYMSKNGIKRLLYWHIGTEEHIHLAIHARYSL